MALTVSFTSRISTRRGQDLALLPREYWPLFSQLRWRRVRVRVNGGEDEFEYTGRITVIEGRVYATLPRSAQALRRLARYHVFRVELA